MNLFKPIPGGAEALRVCLRRRGLSTAADLVRELGLSQPTLSRALAALTDGVARIGRARRARYALERAVATYGSRWPLYRIDAKGRAGQVAVLHALHPSSWWFEASTPAPAWLHGEFGEGLFPGLPWFLDDARPQGFVGRSFARQHGPPLGLPDDPNRWNAEHVVIAMLARGDDLPGDFVLGDRSLEVALNAGRDSGQTIVSASRTRRYPDLAARAVAGEPVGSSAAGEQPKFTATIDGGRRGVRHVIVKFTDRIDSRAGRRWADLLVAEHHAAQVLREGGVGAAVTEVLDAGQRRFLEVQRFDRVGASGRAGFATLAAFDGDHYGLQDDWASAADRMETDGWLDDAGARRLRIAWCFAALIGNTDAHFGNAGLEIGEGRPLGVAPVYDMLPMMHRPGPNGEIVDRPFVVRLPVPRRVDVWRVAGTIAVTFWERVASDPRVTRGFQVIARKSARTVREALEAAG
ncbi:MAG: type II toxin-antitoxin system HipA family toxin YjjJ [Deltaproteobacteria bacterium]